MDALFSCFPFFMLAIFSISALPGPSISSQLSEQQWLLGLKSGITLGPTNSLGNWNSHNPLCNWTGITCTTASHTVVALNLSHMRLEGTISPLVGNFSSLQSLDLSNNALEGQIPPQLAQLSRLEILCLHHNQLEGSIPAELSLLTSLKRLHLGVNNLTGIIPSSLGNLSDLVVLYLGENDFEDRIPPELGTLTQLQMLRLHRNQLSGTIPPSLGNLTDLNDLRISYNHLRGSIPPELGLLKLLKTLDLGVNNLTGNIPSSLGNLSALTSTSLAANNLQGPIPVELGMLTQLQWLELSVNKISGTIPSSLTNLSRLNSLRCFQNQLSGHIPWELCTKLSNLQVLILGGNQLSGHIPSSIGNCSNLVELDLPGNQISGVVPMELGRLSNLDWLVLASNQLVSDKSNTLAFFTAIANCSHLTVLSVSYNYLTGVLPSSIHCFPFKLSYLGLSHNMISGSIPQQIAHLTNLSYLDLSNNLFSGNIPSGIKRFHKMERLYLSRNNLEGSIPSEIGQLQSLGLLNLGHNRLSGKIPNSLCSLPQLRDLHLDHNFFSGGIPVSLEGCQNLELLDLSYNKLTGRIPGEVFASLKNLQFYLNLSGNSLRGSLPREIGNIIMVQAIDISGNQLDGEIPNALGGCIALEHVNLSHNAFEGPIPDTLSKLQNLQDMDLSDNFLSGSIPMSLSQLKVLQYINVSFNNLSGPIPEEGLFPNSTVITLLMGNLGLCGPQIYSLPACPKQSETNHSLLKKIVLSAVGIIAFILCSLILGMMWRHKFSRQLFRPSNFVFQRLSYPKFSYQDLVTVTNGFDQDNLLGVGSFGSIYKGILRDGRVVAIKVLDLQNEEAHKSFNTECKVLGRARHRNLIKIISVFSYPGFMGLVLQFACNGSLEKHLHPDRDGEDFCELGLSECLNIAIDVAHGMEYLHHDCFMQVVHCDLKPSNVLLDSDMTALVTDFGISRLTTTPNSTDSSSTTTFALKGSIGYIAPEYGLGGSVSIKGDVYSYGILILEMITRKRPSDDMFLGDMNLQKWVRSALPDRLADIVDSRLLRDADVNMAENRCLLSFISVGLMCTSESPRERPSMKDVAKALESLRTSFMGSATPSHLTSTISNLLRNTNPNPNPNPTASDSQSSTF